MALRHERRSVVTDQPARSLPERPNLEQLKKQAKTLLKDYQQGENSAVELVEQFERQANPENFRLQDAQRILSRSYGFTSWIRLREQVLIDAIKNGDSKNVRAILKNAADPKTILSTPIANETPTVHCFGKDATLLQFASFRKWKGDAVSALLENGAEIDLHSACGLGRTDVIEKILKANPTALESQVDTYYPLQYAIAAGRPESIRCLVKHGEDANRPIQKIGWFDWEDEAVESNSPKWRPVHMCAIWGYNAERVELMKALIESGADLNDVSPLDGNRPIHLTAIYCWVDMAKFLLSQGVGVDSRSVESEGIDVPGSSLPDPAGGYDWTPLMVTSGEGFLDMAEFLIASGADVNTQNSLGRAPLHIAAGGYWKDRESIYAQIVQHLLDRGADPTTVDRDGKRPIDFAKQKGYETVVAILS